MPSRLQRIQGGGDWHFITCSCYRRQPLLAYKLRRDLFLRLLEEVRQKYEFVVSGYVVMPEHFHVIISEPKHGTLALVMQVLKQRASRKCRQRTQAAFQKQLWQQEEQLRSFWKTRYYDFNIYRKDKHFEKLNYMHNNPVKRGFVCSPDLWAWSSCRHYWHAEKGPVAIET